MLIICVIGLPGSGKSTFAKVGQEMGYKYIRMGECVLEEARKMGWKTEGNPDFRFVEFADEMRKERGDTFAADLTSGWIHENCELDDILFVDGCRSIDEYAVFRDMFNNVKMIACESDLDTRYKRVKNRGRMDDMTTMVEFVAREKAERLWGSYDVMGYAHYSITNNNDDVEAFKKMSESFLRGILYVNVKNISHGCKYENIKRM